MGLTDNQQMVRTLTDNWQIAWNLTDNWHLPWVLLTTDKGPDCPLFSTKPVFKALNSIYMYNRLHNHSTLLRFSQTKP